MFDSITKRERSGAGKLVLVVALAAVAFAAEAALFAEIVGKPVVAGILSVRPPSPREPTRDDLPEFVEEIEVTAPYRMRRASPAARVSPWKHPDPVSVAVNGYCLVEP